MKPDPPCRRAGSRYRMTLRVIRGPARSAAPIIPARGNTPLVAGSRSGPTETGLPPTSLVSPLIREYVDVSA